jgi:hypothetical protein
MPKDKKVTRVTVRRPVQPKPQKTTANTLRRKNIIQKQIIEQ